LKKTFIDEIEPGQGINDIFVIRDLQSLEKKNGDPYLRLTILDKTGEINCVMWDRVEESLSLLKSHTYARISGKVSQYQGALQCTVTKVEDVGEVDPADFLPVVDKDIDEMTEQLLYIMQKVHNVPLGDLLDSFFDDKSFTSLFRAAPGGKAMHHAYVGGLLEHTLTMAEMGLCCCIHIPTLDSGLLITGIVLHDIGKIHEYTYDNPPIDKSDAGRLIGHIGIGLQMLDQKLKKLSEFPEALADHLRHMIISHHGKIEWGSPEPPKTLEAVVLHNLDMLDAQVNAAKSFMDQHPGGGWTGYHRVLNRHFYKGE